jgi:hypothetical protein
MQRLEVSCAVRSVGVKWLKFKGRVNSGLKCGRKQSFPYWRFCPGIGMQELRKSAKNFNHVTLSPVQDLGPNLLRYETRVSLSFRYS